MPRMTTDWRVIAVGFSLCASLICASLIGSVQAARADSSGMLGFAAFSLADAERLAVGQSPDVEAARAAIDAAAASLAQARGTNGLSAIVGYTQLQQSSGVPAITWAQRLDTYQLQTTLGDVAALSPLAAQAAAALRGSITDELVAERTERLKLIGLYFPALQARADLLAKRDAVARASAFEDDLSAQFSAAKAPYLDLLRAEVALSKARADSALALGVDANATDALARETGLHAADLNATREQDAPEPVVIDADRALARAFAQRPELRSAENGVRAAQAGLAAARRGIVPPITVAGGYLRGVDVGNRIGGPIASVSVQIPLSGITHARIAAQQAAVRTALAKEQSVRRALALEVGAAAHTAIAATLARDETETTLEAARSTATFASMQYATHAISGLNVSDARAIYDQAVLDEIAAQYGVMQAQSTLDVELSP